MPGWPVPECERAQNVRGHIFRGIMPSQKRNTVGKMPVIRGSGSLDGKAYSRPEGVHARQSVHAMSERVRARPEMAHTRSESIYSVPEGPFHAWRNLNSPESPVFLSGCEEPGNITSSSCDRLGGFVLKIWLCIYFVMVLYKA